MKYAKTIKQVQPLFFKQFATPKLQQPKNTLLREIAGTAMAVAIPVIVTLGIMFAIVVPIAK